jgi:multiple antibiotic resistance protein
MPSFQEALSTFVVLLAVIDPIGTVPIFIALTKKYSAQEMRKIATRSIAISAAVLLFFLFAGEVLLKTMGILLPAFQISGGIILFIFALSMIFGQSKLEDENVAKKSLKETAIFPLAMPSLASPGAILAVVLLTDNSRYSFKSQLFTALILLIVLGITWALLVLSKNIYRLVGESGVSIMSRIMGLILASLAANNVLFGIKNFFQLA